MNEKSNVFCISMQRTGTTSVGKFFQDFGFNWAGWPMDKKTIGHHYGVSATMKLFLIPKISKNQMLSKIHHGGFRDSIELFIIDSLILNLFC